MFSFMYPNEFEKLNNKEPLFFKDLNLDQIAKAIYILDSEKESIKYFYSPTNNLDTIKYRQDIFKDLFVEENYYKMINFFNYMYQIEINIKKSGLPTNWFNRRELVILTNKYVLSIKEINDYLNNANIKSLGLNKFKEFINDYIKSDKFIELDKSLKKLKDEISKIKYTMVIKGNEIYISNFEDEVDFKDSINNIFSVFDFKTSKEYKKVVPDVTFSKDIDELILDGISKINKDAFNIVIDFTKNHQNFYNNEFYRLNKEIRFYFSYLIFMDKIKSNGLLFNIPNVSNNKCEHSTDSFDLALAYKLYFYKKAPITNSFSLEGSERIIIVSGPNQGGKTTFARQFGQLHYLASLGLPIPGRESDMFLCDNIYTHFKTEENLENLNGKLQSELLGVKNIIDNSTTNSIIILNEIFQSTTSKDGMILGGKLIDMLTKKDNICLFVSFLDKLSTYNKNTTSMVSTVNIDNPEERTFKIVKREADGKAYAFAISNKYHLTYDDIRRRIK